MKTSGIFRMMGIVLISLLLTNQAEAATRTHRGATKSAIVLTVDRPVIEFMAKAYSDNIDANDIFRLQKVAGQIEQVTVTFREKEASDYVLTFKSLDEAGLEAWMFNEGYLASGPEAVSVSQDVAIPGKTVNRNFFKTKKKSVNLTVETPIIEYLARIYADQVEADDILRLQKLCKQIDHITVTFRDEDAVDYVLNFKCLDDKGLEEWMFNEGYLIAYRQPELESIPLEPWMLDSKYLE